MLSCRPSRRSQCRGLFVSATVVEAIPLSENDDYDRTSTQMHSVALGVKSCWNEYETGTLGVIGTTMFTWRRQCCGWLAILPRLNGWSDGSTCCGAVTSGTVLARGSATVPLPLSPRVCHRFLWAVDGVMSVTLEPARKDKSIGLASSSSLFTQSAAGEEGARHSRACGGTSICLGEIRSR